jgi:hypothetical protein
LGEEFTMTGFRSRHVMMLAAATLTLAVIALPGHAGVSIPGVALECQLGPYYKIPLTVIVRAKTPLHAGTHVYVQYFIKPGAGQKAQPRTMDGTIASDAPAETWLPVVVDNAFVAVLSNGTLAKGKGCTAHTPIATVPPAY